MIPAEEKTVLIAGWLVLWWGGRGQQPSTSWSCGLVRMCQTQPPTAPLHIIPQLALPAEHLKLQPGLRLLMGYAGKWLRRLWSAAASSTERTSRWSRSSNGRRKGNAGAITSEGSSMEFVPPLSKFACPGGHSGVSREGAQSAPPPRNFILTLYFFL